MTSTKTTFGNWEIDENFLTLKSGYFIPLFGDGGLLKDFKEFSDWIQHMLRKSECYDQNNFIRAVISILNSKNQNLTSLSTAVNNWYKETCSRFEEHKKDSIRPYDASSGKSPGPWITFKERMEMAPDPADIKRVDDLYKSITTILKEVTNEN